ncbi:ATP-dependent DNA ligase [Agromyces sp. Marseille-P2726]|uniref:DUF7882 family protein n=1 Tax=Agromyces sp. Marseille-P2726 TaxID=2709132 RepID=UPI00156FCAEC|nr:ATP-dependent DNA ligase [Agromyces sp. Marseille-P2726]
MGKLTYDSTLTVDFDDRVLAHLQLVIGAKLRRSEAFFFSWRDDPGVGDGRSTLWLHPTIPLYFKFSGGRQPSVNRAWVDQLMNAANSPGGLHLVPEPPEYTNGGEREP